jgi:hypothetical protein
MKNAFGLYLLAALLSVTIASSSYAGCFNAAQSWILPLSSSHHALHGNPECENILFNQKGTQFEMKLNYRWTSDLTPSDSECSEISQYDRGAYQIVKSIKDHMGSTSIRTTMTKAADGSLTSVKVEKKDTSRLGGTFSRYKVLFFCHL